MSRKLTQEEFINRCKEVHGDKYDYSLVEYVSSSTKVDILCVEHGVFLQTPSKHLTGRGCRKCADKQSSLNKRCTTENFIKKAQEVHGNKYDYSKVEYLRNNKDVIIICPIHGESKQKPVNHHKGSGCQECASLINIYSRESYIKLSPIATLYLVLLEYENEVFYKIGKTKNTTKQRLQNNISSYKFKIINEFITKSDIVFDLENKLHNKYKKYKYKPNIHFAGHTECYTMDLPIEEIINLNKAQCQRE